MFELTRDFDVILPLMLSTVLAALVFAAVSQDSIYTERLSRRGIRVGGELTADPLRTTAVSDVMNRLVDTVKLDAPAGEVADRISRGERGAFPLVDDNGRCVGIVTRRDLLSQKISRDGPVGELASTDIVSVSPGASLLDALQLMVDENIEHLVVLDKEQLVGICTRADIVRAKSDELALERIEEGWLAPVLQQGTSSSRRYLVVGNKSLGSAALSREIASRLKSSASASFHVVVPLPRGDDLSEARQRLEQQLHEIEQLGGSASGDVGAADPLIAIEQALDRESANGLILSTLPPSRSRWLHGDFVTRLNRRIAIECIVVHDEDEAVER